MHTTDSCTVTVIDGDATAALARLTMRYGVRSCGVLMVPIGAWNQISVCEIQLDDTRTVSIAHDERGAPFVTTASGEPDDRVLVSLTDEGGLKVCAWAEVAHPCMVRGIGVDMATQDDFAGERGNAYNHLLFTAPELDWASQRPREEPRELSLAFVFSAKEAAFKALSAPLRTWYQSHDDELFFEVRDFELVGYTTEKGTARKGAAQHAMEAMGIVRIELERMVINDMALTFAVALS